MIDVHRAGIEDFEAALTLFEGYLRFYEREHPPEDVRRFLQARLDEGSSVLYLARDGGRAVGVAQVYPTYSSVSLAPVWVLNDLFVDPAARGGGAGRALLRTVCAEAQRAGAVRVTLETAEDNVRAQALYEAEGFTTEDDHRHYTRPV